MIRFPAEKLSKLAAEIAEAAAKRESQRNLDFPEGGYAPEEVKANVDFRETVMPLAMDSLKIGIILRNQMDISKMTPQQRAELKAQLEAQERAEKQKREDDVNAYKDLVSGFCHRTKDRLLALSGQMRQHKDEVFNDVESIIQLKEALYNTKVDRHSNSFTADGITVTLGRRTNDGWDDTVEVGISKVKEFLGTLAKDEDSAKLYKAVMQLLSKDRKGNLKASAMLQLEKYAAEWNDPLFSEGVSIIRNAYSPVETCDFISVSYKDKEGKVHAIPLSLAAMTKED